MVEFASKIFDSGFFATIIVGIAIFLVISTLWIRVTRHKWPW